jgi:hypothetical protein
MRLFLRLVLLIFAASLTGQLHAATYTGTVVSLNGDIAKVAMDGDIMPTVGARAEIFFRMAGFDDEISVASGSALKIDHGDLLVKIEEGTGTVEKGHLVRFGLATSTTPGTSPQSTASPSPAATLSIVGAWAGNEPGGDQISFTFKEDGTVSYVRLRGKTTNVLRGKYRANCAMIPCRLELFQFKVNGVKAKGETIIGLFELHESDMKFDLSTEVQRQPEKGFTKGVTTLVREKSETPPTATSNDEIDLPNTFNEARKPSPPSSPAATATGFTGRWNVQNENADYVLSLREQGNRVTGSYSLYGGTLAGTVRGGTLHATWKQPQNRRGGSATLRLSADGETLSGTWQYNPATFSSGLRGSGIWTFKRSSRSP